MILDELLGIARTDREVPECVSRNYRFMATDPV